MDRTILVAENDGERARRLCNMLGRLGFDVEWFSDGARAFERAAHGNHWGVVLSLHMPRLNGTAAATALRRRRPDLKIVLIGDALTPRARQGIAGIPGVHCFGRAVTEDDLRAALSDAPAPAPRMNLLLVEDFEPVRSLVRSHFEELGWDVKAVADGGSAIWEAARGRAEVALVDMAIPGPQGADLIRKLREANPAIFIFVITGGATEEEIARAFAAGAGGLMRKPFRPHDLVEALRDRRRESAGLQGRN